LQQEIENFKTHFARYDSDLPILGEELFNNKAKTNMENQIVYDISFLMKEREINLAHNQYVEY